MKANEAPEKLYLHHDLSHPAGKRYLELNKMSDKDVEYTRTDSFIKKAKEAFCKVRCKGKPPRSTCTSLGTCIEYDEFKKAIKL